MHISCVYIVSVSSDSGTFRHIYDDEICGLVWLTARLLTTINRCLWAAAEQCGNGALALAVAHSTDFPIKYG